ncbi:MAG: DUF3124 domain-containing protein [Saprospiraceae bacterium]
MQITQNISTLILSLIIISFFACQPPQQNVDSKGRDILKKHEVNKSMEDIVNEFQDTIYVPIYSDIYSQSKNVSFLLTATLSIRNTSMHDSIYIEAIDYYNTNGDLVRKYTDNTLFLKPLESIDYVVDEQDESGGTGANFIIIWGAKNDQIKPIFEAVMISTQGQQGISFTTQGTSISRRK